MRPCTRRHSIGGLASFVLVALVAQAALVALPASRATAGGGASGAAGPPARVTLDGLLAEMVDLMHWTRFPSPSYRHRLASSTDPSATTPLHPDSWFKNADAGHYLRAEQRGGRTEYVALDVKGPGVIMRIWSATPEGTLRIYIDDMEEPVLEEDMSLLLSGGVEPFSEPFAYLSARGANLYFPFACAARCKVTLDSDDAFYQVNYRSYAASVSVEPFSRAGLASAQGAMDRVASILENPERAYQATADSRSAAYPFDASDDPTAGATALANGAGLTLEGPRVVRRVELRPSKTDAETLRSLVLVMDVDGEETVRVPFGDFFGSGPGLSAFASMAAEVSETGVFTSRWPIPFARSFSLRVEGAQDSEESEDRVAVKGRVWHEPWTPDANSLRFHASWRHEYKIPSWPPRDWSLIEIQGRGLYAGTLFQVANSTKGWWGEGDEKIWVDDETFPSHFGTGTEDYFGYAWSTPARFVRPYHAQTRADGPGGYGYFSMHRWHLLDPIPFATSLRFDQELWHWAHKGVVSLSAVAFYYAAPGASDNGFTPKAGEIELPEIGPLPVKQVKDALEGESMQARASGGKAAPEHMVRYLASLWSGDRHLAWRGGVPGDRLAIRFEAPERGRYHVFGYFTKARDYGIHQILLNGVAVGEPVDFWSSMVTTADDVDLGVHKLRKGANVLGVELVGARERAEGTAFGLDCLRLQRVP